MNTLVNYTIGADGVNVDKSDLHMSDTELRQAQNAIKDPLGVEGGLKNRPGLINFNADAANGIILGGTGIPLQNLITATALWYIGRGQK